MNSITLIGRVATVPVYHCNERAQDLLRIQLRTKSSDGTTQLHHCVAWGPAALDLHRHLHTGNQLMIRGELRYRERSGAGPQVRCADVYVRGYTYLDGRKPRPRPTTTTVPESAAPY